MTALDVRRLSDHVLVPDNTRDGRKTIRNGWKCRDCLVHWDELPPVAERLNACPVDAERT